MQSHSDISPPPVSIVMLSKNEARYIRETLTMVFDQQIDQAFEVIVIDSGSTDGTLDIVAEFPARLKTIPPHEFGHGRTRNMALELARGEILVFLNADATPVDTHWLDRMVRHFRTFDRLAGVYGRQLPRDDCDPLMKRELLMHPVFSSPLTRLSFISDTETYQPAPDSRIRLPHFITISCAVSRAVFTAYPFRQDIEFAEDLEWGIRVVEAGYGVLFEPHSAVVHSHNIYASASQTLRKSFDVYTATVDILGQSRSVRRQRLLSRWMISIIKDTVTLLSQDRRSFLFTIRWLFRIPFIRTIECLGGILALHRHRVPRRYLERLSLVSAIKRGDM